MYCSLGLFRQYFPFHYLISPQERQFDRKIGKVIPFQIEKKRKYVIISKVKLIFTSDNGNKILSTLNNGTRLKCKFHKQLKLIHAANHLFSSKTFIAKIWHKVNTRSSFSNFAGSIANTFAGC